MHIYIYSTGTDLSKKKRHQPFIHPWVLERVFGNGMLIHTNHLGLGKRHWNSKTFSAVVKFQPPHLIDKCVGDQDDLVMSQHVKIFK